jgi:hypothetical protein
MNFFAKKLMNFFTKKLMNFMWYTCKCDTCDTWYMQNANCDTCKSCIKYSSYTKNYDYD